VSTAAAAAATEATTLGEVAGSVRDCVFCGGPLFVAKSAGASWALCHGLPACATFLSLCPTAFLRAVRAVHAGGAS
jgi:hypothetical protein